MYLKYMDASKGCTQACYKCFGVCLAEQNVMARVGCISTFFEYASICTLASYQCQET